MKRLNPTTLAHCASIAWGERWIAPLAEALSRETGRRVAPAQIYQWLKELRPIPEWVADVIVPTLYRRAHQLRARAAATVTLAVWLEDDLAPPVPPDAGSHVGAGAAPPEPDADIDPPSEPRP